MKTLLKNGYIIDGTGQKGYKGNLVINEEIIEELTTDEIENFQGHIIECENYCIAPGFIDAHSHNDWFAAVKEPDKYFEPFIQQGITTQIVGNCGFSPFGFPKDTAFRNLVGGGLFTIGDAEGDFYSLNNWYDAVEGKIPINLAPLLGHGTVRIGISGDESRSMSIDELKKMEGIIMESLEAGAFGVSIGLMYMPGRYADDKELQLVARIVKDYQGILTSHGRAYSAVSTSYTPPIGGVPHNLRALEEMINLAIKTNVKLEYSHLIFVGEKSFKTVDKALEMLDNANRNGADIGFDIYPMTCGASIITVILPNWYFSLKEEEKNNILNKLRIAIEIGVSKKALGFGFEDIVVTWCCEELKDLAGMTVHEIAKVWKVSDLKAYLQLAEKSDYNGKVVMYKYADENIISILSKHEKAVYMTDAWVEDLGTQNPAIYGAFPRFLRNSREGKGADLETTVRKMSGLTAERFCIDNRGILKKGNYADITIFDHLKVSDRMEEALPPIGIKAVYVNGELICEDGIISENLKFTGKGLRKRSK